MGTHSVLFPGQSHAEEPGGLQSMGSQELVARVTNTSLSLYLDVHADTYTHIHTQTHIHTHTRL